MKRVTLLRFVSLVLVVLSRPSAAYDPPTHSAISTVAARNSLIGDGTKLVRNAVPDFDGLPLGRSTIKYGDSVSGERTVLELFTFGAEYEDDRSLLNGTRHFFNPLNGQGLITPVRNFISSPDWILGDRSDPGHDFTWKKARSDFLKASTDPDKAVRKQSWGLTFQKLGHVIHHVQDMAQPQHARNDPHCEGRLATLRDSLSRGANYVSVLFVAV